MRAVIALSAALVLALAALLSFAPDRARSSPVDENAVADQYIVVLQPGATVDDVMGQPGLMAASVEVQHVYEFALNGFAARIPPSQLGNLAANDAVLAIVPDQKVRAYDDIRPSGVRRSEADRNAITQITSHTNPVSVDVAVLDSGIDSDHPDLNVAGGYSCVPGESSWEDANGHGTHVAGIIGALDNGSGVVGVAPGARLWSIRVLNAQGEGEVSDLICAVDWVTANASTIEVANLSLGTQGATGSCSDGGLHQAICVSVSAGITYVVAAGNEGVDAGGSIPASYDEVITVSALTDLDGKPGGEGGFNFFYGADDTLASFSNFGPAIDIAAPGVDIFSTWMGGSYFTQSGTSMAAPHVAGAAAIYLYQNPGALPAAVESHLQSVAWAQNSPKGFTGDVDGYPEKLLNVGEVGGLPPLDPPPLPEAQCSASPDHGTPGTSMAISCQGFPPGAWVWIYLDSVNSNARGLMVASSAGDAATTLPLPQASFGEHQFILNETSQGTTASVPFTVEPNLTLNVNTGVVGGWIVGNLNGFGASEVVRVVWERQDGTTQEVASSTTTNIGIGGAYFPIPQSPAGEYRVTATGQTTGATASKTIVVQSSVKAAPSNVQVGQALDISVQGFEAGTTVDLALDAAPWSTLSTSSLGSATVRLNTPEISVGTHTLTATSFAGVTASTTLTIRSSISISPSQTKVGDQVAVTLNGFGGGESVALVWSDSTGSTQQVGSATAGSTGSVATTFAVPPAGSGSHRLEARGGSSGSVATAYVYVNTSISLDPNSGVGGTEVAVQLEGFPINASVNVEWHESYASITTMTTVVTSSTGSATASFIVPSESSAGDHNVRAKVASSYQSATTVFTVDAGPGGSQASCSIDPAVVQPGVNVSINCWAFERSQWIRLYLDSESSPMLAMLYAPSGNVTGTFKIWDAAAGPHTLIGVGSVAGDRSETPVEVIPRLSTYLTSVKVGSYITVTLQGFGANETADVVWQAPSGTTTPVAIAGIDAKGRSVVTFRVPDVAGGTHTLVATGRATGMQASLAMQIVPGITLSPPSGSAGSTLNITLAGFAAGEQVGVHWDGTEIATATTSVNGSAIVPIVVPEVPGGKHTLDAVTPAGVAGSASFTVTPNLVMTPARGVAGSTITLTVTGYAASETVNVNWYDTATAFTTLTVETTGPDGSAEIAITVPFSSRGTHRISVVGPASGSSRSAYFYVDPSIEVTPASGVTGSAGTVNLSGFNAGETVELRWYNTSYSWTVIATGVAASNGTASIAFTVPANATPGSHKVEAYGTGSYTKVSKDFSVI